MVSGASQPNPSVQVRSFADIPVLVRELLDRNYENAAQQTLLAINAQFEEGVMKTRGDQLEAEMARLEQVGEPLTADNAVLRAYLADLETTMQAVSLRVDAIAGNLQLTGQNAAAILTQELALAGLSAEVRQGIQWLRPDPEAVNAAVNFVNNPAWTKELQAYSGRVVEAARNKAILGIINGKSPIATAREVRKIAQQLTIAQANTTMRTLQLASYREATAVNQLANADILEGQIRIAVLDQRTCMGCIALNGTRLAVGEVISDHHNGRCTSVAVIKGRRINIVSGEDWFNARTPQEQVSQMGIAAFEDWSNGKIVLNDFIQPYKDDVFGQMTREASLKEIWLKKYGVARV